MLKSCWRALWVSSRSSHPVKFSLPNIFEKDTCALTRTPCDHKKFPGELHAHTRKTISSAQLCHLSRNHIQAPAPAQSWQDPSHYPILRRLFAVRPNQATAAFNDIFCCNSVILYFHNILHLLNYKSSSFLYVVSERNSLDVWCGLWCSLDCDLFVTTCIH